MGDFAWPNRDEFGYVERVWPQAKEMKRQFAVLSLILRLNSHRQDWYKVSSYLLSISMKLDPFFSMILGRCLGPFPRAKWNELFAIKQRIWRYLEPLRTGAMFEGSTDSLGKLGQKSRFKQVVKFKKDSAAVFTKNPFKDRIVMVEQVLQDQTCEKLLCSNVKWMTHRCHHYDFQLWIQKAQRSPLIFFLWNGLPKFHRSPIFRVLLNLSCRKTFSLGQWFLWPCLKCNNNKTTI